MRTLSLPVRDGMYYAAFLLVELVAALEVTAMLVAAPALSPRLGGVEDGWLLNSYLYPVFGCMLLFMLLHAFIQRRFSALNFLLVGLGLFAAGNAVCAATDSTGPFLLGRALQGIGGAAAFTGQLWTAGEHYRRTITRPMFWGECGVALGIVAGPLVGGLLTSLTEQSWRLIFVLNGGLGLVAALLTLAALAGRTPPRHDDELVAAAGFKPGLAPLVLAQCAVSTLAVGMEFHVSSYLQNALGKTPMFVGLLTVAASAGAVAGSYVVMALDRNFDRLARLGMWGMVLSIVAVGALLADWPVLAAAPIFAMGLALGLSQMAIYAQLVQITPPSRFVLVSLIYLLAMQAGNALGIQGIELAGLKAATPLSLLGLFCALPAAFALWFSRHAPLADAEEAKVA